MFTVSFQPIASWPVVALMALVVTGLTLWAYLPRMRGTSGAWRWVALTLRLAAVALCVVAALRPSVIFQKKQKQPATLIFLTDDSSSMSIKDEARSRSRWDVARETLGKAREAAAELGEDLRPRYFKFGGTLRDDPAQPDPKEKAEAPDANAGPTGRATAVGTSLLEAVRRETGTRVATVFLLSDGSNNLGVSPLVAARQLKGLQVPVVTVGFGSETAGPKSRDIAVRELATSPTVFVKNQMQVRGSLLVRGFPDEPIDVELLVEGQNEPVATQRVKASEGKDTVSFNGLRYVPQTPGEKKVTVRVKPREGELVQSNNEVSTFVTVLKGGLNVLFVQGPHSPWEQKYLMRSVASSPDIQAELRVLRRPARDGSGELKDEEFAPEKYDVYILSDVSADYFTPTQQALLARQVERGAGLIMLGGRSSFGEGGWGSTDVARVLPVTVRPGDGQLDPPDGIKFLPNPRSLETFLMQVGPSRAESMRIWNDLPPLSGINRFATLKPSALIFGQSPGNRPEPIMVGMEVGNGRSLAFAGETWVWARVSDEGRLAHRKLWRQIIFWLAHKEDKGENEVKIDLDARRIAAGQKLEVGVTARDAKGEPLTGLTLESRVERETDDAKKASEKLDLFNQGEGWKGTYYATDSPPGDYKVTVVAKKNGQEVGRDSARFLVYQDDRELEHPAADRAQLRMIAEASGGESIAPEQLVKYIQSLKGKVFTDSLIQTERKVWDNWPFLLAFTALLVAEWWLRKKNGWV